MESYTDLNPVETEEINTLDEAGVSPMPNSDVLINFGEDENGTPTYKGELIAGERPTIEPVEFLLDYSYEVNMDISEATINNNVVIAAIIDPDNDYTNKEIAKIEFSFDSGESWVDIKDFIKEDPCLPYTINVHKSFAYNNGSYDTVCFGTLGFTLLATTHPFFADIKNGNQYGFRVTFYKD